MKAITKRAYNILFAAYIVLLILVVLLKFDGSFEQIISFHHSMVENEQNGINNVNLVLFNSISPYLKNIWEPYAFRNLIGNIAAFIPLGFFIFSYSNHKIGKTIVICVSMILMMECTQLIFKIGFFDIDDIVLNTVGCLLGILFRIACCIMIQGSKARKRSC